MRSHLESEGLIRVSLFDWEATWERILASDNLKRRGQNTGYEAFPPEGGRIPVASPPSPFMDIAYFY